jgi:pentatricopeptide repeat protein
MDGFLAALARAPPSAACRGGPALAVTFFNGMSRAASPRVLSPTFYTYSILMDCCNRACHPELTLAFFGQLLRTGLGVTVITLNNLLKSLCQAKRNDDALDVLLHRMPELGCMPDVFSYSILMKSLCVNRESRRALELLRGMAKRGACCAPDVVSYNTVIDGFFKEGEIAKGCDLLNEMVNQGISPSLVTYSPVSMHCARQEQWTRQRRSSDKWFVKVFVLITGHILT